MVELFLAMEKVACSSHVLRSICDYGLKAMLLGFQPSGLGLKFYVRVVVGEPIPGCGIAVVHELWGLG